MYTDAQNRPSNNQSVASAVGTIVSTDRIDLLTANRNVGRGVPMRAVTHLTAALTSAGAATIQAQLVESANADGSSPRVLATGDTIALADAVAGAELLDVPVPDTTRRYLGFQYVIAGATTTGGTVSSHIVAGTDRRSNDITMNTGL